MKNIDGALLVSLGLNLSEPIIDQHLCREVVKMEHERDVYKLMYENLLDRLFHMAGGDRNA